MSVSPVPTRRRRLRRIWTPQHPNPTISEKTTWFQPTLDTLREQEYILANNFFLVRQGDEFGERLRCSRCNTRHDYITLMCVEKPISGLYNGLWAYYRALKASKAESDLSPSDLARLQDVYEVLRKMPDLSKVHPQFARKVVQDIGPSDLQVGAVSLGILEVISPTQAIQLVEKINIRGLRPPYRLSPVNQAEIDRALEYRGTDYHNRSRGRW